MKINRYLSLFVIPIAFSFIQTSCTQGPSMPGSAPSNPLNSMSTLKGGVGVGNGMATYESLAYKFQITYPKELKLTEVSNRNFFIDNSSQDEIPSEKISKIEFFVTEASELKKKGIESLEDLSVSLQTKKPGTQYSKIDFPGAAGLYFEEKTTDTLRGEYYILTTNGDLVSVEINSFSWFNGMTAIDPIVKTFIYDGNAPLVHELFVKNSHFSPGKNAILYFRATDDYSGVEVRLVSGWFSSPEHTQTKLPFSGMASRSEFLGDNWYAVEFQVGPYLPEGKYFLETFSLQDKAGNIRYLSAPTCSEPSGLCGDTYNQSEGVELPIVMIQVSHSDLTDTDAPMIYGLRSKTTVVQAGEDATIFFEATETHSGFQGGESMASGWFEPADEVRADSGSRNLTFGGSFNTTVVPAPELGENWFALTFKVGPYKIPGIYNLVTFSLKDAAGNQRYLAAPTCRTPGGLCGKNYRQTGGPILPVVKIEVKNPGTPDTTKPVIEAIELVTPTVVAGQKGTLRFKAKDDLSGIDNGKVVGWFQTLDNLSSDKDIFFSGTIDFPGSSARSLGEGWFEVDFETDPFLRAGTYILNVLSLEDMAQNSRYLVAPTCGSGLCGKYYRQADELEIPIQTLTLIR